jgi:hypothetical protein
MADKRGASFARMAAFMSSLMRILSDIGRHPYKSKKGEGFYPSPLLIGQRKY